MIDLFPIVGPILRSFDPETAHGLTIKALSSGLMPPVREKDDPILRSRVFGLDFANPVGLAAGFDKNAEVVDAMLRLGFGFVEAGSVTPRPQPGNPRPRLFRVPEQGAVINRMGFNNEGLEPFVQRLERRQSGGRKAPGLVGANLGKNKDTVEAADDYVLGVTRVAALADYLVVNVSSPNTPGLRALQGRDPLRTLLGRVLDARSACRLAKAPPVLLKIAPDLTDEDKADIAAVALESGIDGLIVSNTTIARPAEIPEPLRGEAGGLSGKPLFAPSTAVLREMYGLTGGKLPLVGVGGIASGADAYAKIRAGASLVQLYSALVYAGPALVLAIRRDLAALLRRDGFVSLSDAVGADHR
ncbi:quinone-dependent dihydroorotate dehydrogenase [Azospirillum brasilense]|uniref:Dihydroorotate dehydrogenase (quinone) n=1 Tax=Azospirillum brasilense TaxID=192 RepID=A0A0P0E8G3_AZOBR|nr:MULTISPECIES: quinone-dependent dihydroorotate dehydrogenase [Azospirillum]ALJ34476.1 dihydroorotate dehydrogenase (quinone) [Azospirillum brasilense]MDW7554181.1 quinone-dependent dihydroorotate dehydrogenase [Azospirillum brasilense]MDW7593560.1 quinone-dependent dihydroorotate dehydrogenase [Azospirillum brasilense]MDW7627197.1 quinone-dependent dihydroorotate dehydrogenase [Azospirillum brasilense]MDX5953099.1 quinone-dependent dihydroorotate dehydrogenase [Azospirillum brasilense]